MAKVLFDASKYTASKYTASKYTRTANCDHENLKRIYGPHPGGHHCKVICADCSWFIKWEAKPKEKKSRKGQAELRNRFCKDYCEMCLSRREDLVLPDTLEIHHVLEVQHGGTDDPKNLQTLCTGCHKMVHWRRTYNRHSSFEDKLKEIHEISD